jgi:hypothetical protein
MQKVHSSSIRFQKRLTACSDFSVGNKSCMGRSARWRTVPARARPARRGGCLWYRPPTLDTRSKGEETKRARRIRRRRSLRGSAEEKCENTEFWQKRA